MVEIDVEGFGHGGRVRLGFRVRIFGKTVFDMTQEPCPGNEVTTERIHAMGEGS